MLNFSSSTLKNDIIQAIEKLAAINGDIEDITFSDFLDLNESEYDDISIDENSTVTIYIGEEDYPSVTVGQFINMAQTKDQLKINGSQSYAKNDHEVFFLLDITDYNTIELLSNTFRGMGYYAGDGNHTNSILNKDAKIDDNMYHICLFNGFCIYHLLVEESGNHDKYYPSYSSADCFVKISCDAHIVDMRIADELATAYVFELQATLNILLSFSNGRIDTDWCDVSDKSLCGMESNLFPLVCGIGTTELLRLYNTAKNTLDINFKLLGFTKVIEYIAPTISQKNLIESVSLKLTSTDVFKPTAAFISELGAIYDKHRNTVSKDIELIKLSIHTVVELNVIWENVPAFIKGKQEKLPDESDFNIYLERIAESIYSTRNEIAHAKANYEKRGTECPNNYKNGFCFLLDMIAVRCVRWFALQPEEKRVVLR